MRSRLPKVLHPVSGRPMLQHVLHTAYALNPAALAVVVGSEDNVRLALDRPADIVAQAQQLGTGHAVLQARAVLEGRADIVLVLYGDTPLLTSETLHRLVETHRQHHATITLLTTRITDPTLRPNGRILRDAAGEIRGIVEAPEATPEQRVINECNMGIYTFQDDWLWPALAEVKPSAVKGEIYLTTLIGMAFDQGRRVSGLLTHDYSETLGVDNRMLLSEAEAVMRRRINRHWQTQGVTLVDPDTTYIESEVQLRPDTIILPGCHLQGQTVVGEGCRIGPHTILRDATVGERCIIEMAVVEGVALEAGQRVHPFTHLSQSV